DTLKELYGRICFNVLCGNTDDHARNHAAFWDGRMLTLTASTLATLLAGAPDYHLKEAEAATLIENQVTMIAASWPAVCAEAELSTVDRKLFAGRQFLNSYAFEGLEGQKALQDAFRAARDALIASGGA
ncbi:type II toxin-antitoxin system HipA family toxin, partial [Rhizobium leguminosarum]